MKPEKINMSEASIKTNLCHCGHMISISYYILSTESKDTKMVTASCSSNTCTFKHSKSIPIQHTPSQSENDDEGSARQRMILLDEETKNNMDKYIMSQVKIHLTGAQ